VVIKFFKWLTSEQPTVEPTQSKPSIDELRRMVDEITEKIDTQGG